MGSLASMEEIAEAALRRRAAWEARQRAFEPDGGSLSSTVPQLAPSPPTRLDSMEDLLMAKTPPLGVPRASSLQAGLTNSSTPSSPQAQRRHRRSLSFPTSNKLRRAARALTTKARQSQHAQEQVLYLLYVTRTSRERGTVGWLTDPLAAWRLYWRWAGILILLLNSFLLLAAGWVRHRTESDPTYVPPRCWEGSPSAPGCAAGLHDRLVAHRSARRKILFASSRPTSS